jgi:predicted glycosyltransferase
MHVFFYVQHLLGIGHMKRAAALSRALLAKGARVTLALGGEPVPGVDTGAAELLQLPPCRAADETFRVLLDEEGKAIDDAWREARREALLEGFAAAQPDRLMTEMFPFGRRAFRFELIPLLEHARMEKVPVACSVRDILVAKTRADRVREMTDTAKLYYDMILVHGDPTVLPFAASFPEAERLSALIRYTGYVADSGGDRWNGTAGRDEIVVSVGGGMVGEQLLRVALAAATLTRQPRRWHLLVGPNTPKPIYDALRAEAPDNVMIEPARPDFALLLRNCALSVSQAGYNTVIDVLRAGCRSIVVPFAGGAESEQTTRAKLLARRGLLRLLPEESLTPENLAFEVDRAVGQPKPGRVSFDLDGAERAAELLCTARP